MFILYLLSREMLVCVVCDMNIHHNHSFLATCTHVHLRLGKLLKVSTKWERVYCKSFSLESVMSGIFYIYFHYCSHRLWFPCVDSYTEPCQWDFSFTVPNNMIAVSCGDLTEQVDSYISHISILPQSAGVTNYSIYLCAVIINRR